MDTLSREGIAEVARACERLSAEVVVAERDALATGVNATVLVGHLRAGERQIPQDVHSYLVKDGSTASLLLLCEDDLVRPSVSLCSGRIALLGASRTAESIASRLRVLIADQLTEKSRASSDERAYPHWWSRDTLRDPAASRVFPEEHGGFALFFGLRSALALPVEALNDLRAALQREAAQDTTLDPSIRERAGAEVGVVHYALPSREWIFHWPSNIGTLLLFSPSRIPVLSDFSCFPGERARVRGSSSDVMIAVSETRALSGQEFARDLAKQPAASGPEVFDQLSERLKSRSDAWATVAELR